MSQTAETQPISNEGANQPIIRYEHVSKAFMAHGPDVVALRDVSLDIARHQFTSVIGPSGCGKTTLLRLASGLEAATQGLTRFEGDVVTGVNTRIGYVTQDSNLYPWMTLRQNVEFPLEVRGIPAADRLPRGDAYIRMVGLQGFESHYPYQLSGGMQKRASIIRTMIYDPAVVLMDEPFGALDAQTRLVLQADLLRLQQQRNQTVLFITHDLQEAIALSDTVVVMSARPGTIKGVFQIPLTHPRDVFQIHTQSGFAEIYAEIWDSFRSEITGATRATRPPLVDLPPPLAASRRDRN